MQSPYLQELPPAVVATALDIETPAVVVDAQRLRSNVTAMAALAAREGLRLRPHAKTHKSIALAGLQLGAGAEGLTVAKASEAELFLSAGVASVTIAHPLVDPDKMRRVLRAAAPFEADVRFIADSDQGVDALTMVGREVGQDLPCYLKVDVGLHRCGIDPDGDGALRLARRLSSEAGIRFAGLLSHAGHAYRLADGDAVAEIAGTERAIMAGLAGRLDAAGIEVPAVSVGCTPTVIHNAGFDGITEIRPGNYVYMDRIQVGLGVASLADVALWVAATVVSVNDRYAIIDAGSKVLSSDRGPHGADNLSGYGLAFPLDRPDAAPLTIVSLSEEHGFVDHGGRAPAIGTRVAILPNHACPVANLAHDTIVVLPDGGRERWPVDGRGLVR